MFSIAKKFVVIGSVEYLLGCLKRMVSESEVVFHSFFLSFFFLLNYFKLVTSINLVPKEEKKLRDWVISSFNVDATADVSCDWNLTCGKVHYSSSSNIAIF